MIPERSHSPFLAERARSSRPVPQIPRFQAHAPGPSIRLDGLPPAAFLRLPGDRGDVEVPFAAVGAPWAPPGAMAGPAPPTSPRPPLPARLQ